MPEPVAVADLPVRVSPCRRISCKVLVRMPEEGHKAGKDFTILTKIG